MHCNGQGSHAPIQHEEFHCPLCGALADLEGYEDALHQLEQEIEDLRSLADGLAVADILHAQASEAEADKRRADAECRLYQLREAVRKRPGETMTRRLQRIDTEAR